MRLNLGNKRYNVKVTDDNVQKLLVEYEGKVGKLKSRLSEECKISKAFENEIKAKDVAYGELQNDLIPYEQLKVSFDEMHACYESALELLGDVVDNTISMLTERDARAEKLLKAMEEKKAENAKKQAELTRLKKSCEQAVSEIEAEMVNKVKAAQAEVERLQRTTKQKFDNWMLKGQWK